jgi:hypothetical protein
VCAPVGYNVSVIASTKPRSCKVATVLYGGMDERIGREHYRAAVERALARSFGERIALTERNLDEVAKLEGLYGDWQQARSVKFAAYTLHRAAVGVDPLAADIWAPRLLRRRGGSRADFLRTLQLLWRARERGRLRGNLADEATTLLCEDLAWQSASAAPAPAHGARRCEGRSRAPQGSAGGARAGSGGSRRGGDSNDDSGGGGSDGSGGGSSGSGGSRRRFSWGALGGICGVVSTLLAAANFVFGPLHAAPPPAPAPKVIVKEMQVPVVAKGRSASHFGFLIP